MGSTSEGDVFRYTLENSGGWRSASSTRRDRQSVTAPDRDGRFANVTLGFDNLSDDVEHGAYFGCIAGRYAGRIANGRFTGRA